VNTAAIAYATDQDTYDQMAQVCASEPTDSGKAAMLAITILYAQDHNPHFAHGDLAEFIILFNEQVKALEGETD